MEETSATPLNGRRAEAARNDRLILDAARAVLVGDPGAPIAAVAERAGVGIGALYRRYPSKEALLQRLALDGLRHYIAEAEAALADDADPWAAFARLMRRALDAGAGWLTLRFAGSFRATDEVHREVRRAHEATLQLLERAKAAGALRAEIEVGDLALLFEQLQAIRMADERRARQLRHRYLALMLDALHLPSAPPLPGPAPRREEISERFGA